MMVFKRPMMTRISSSTQLHKTASTTSPKTLSPAISFKNRAHKRTQHHLEKIRGSRDGVILPRQIYTSIKVSCSKLDATQGLDSVRRTAVLFVCLGNICRSPTAEAVFKSVVKNKAVDDRFLVDSCGTGGGNPDWYLDGGWSYHAGEPADERMRAVASKRNITLTSASRPLSVSDLKKFDILVAMDASNVDAMRIAINHWSLKDPSLRESLQKIVLMTDFCQQEGYKAYKHVPDPYYGGRKGFELVLDLLVDACEGLLEHLLSNLKN